MGYAASLRSVRATESLKFIKNMNPKEKIYIVMKKIKEKSLISPKDSGVVYRAGFESSSLKAEDEISILNKLNEEGIIKIIYNSGSEYI